MTPMPTPRYTLEEYHDTDTDRIVTNMMSLEPSLLASTKRIARQQLRHGRLLRIVNERTQEIWYP